MELIIRNTDSQPIYEQIAAQLRRQILSGALAPGEALPSIRALAKDLRISVITTKRAYDELEADGFLYNMVRILAGTLCEAGAGRLQPEEFRSLRVESGFRLSRYACFRRRAAFGGGRRSRFCLVRHAAGQGEARNNGQGGKTLQSRGHRFFLSRG